MSNKIEWQGWLATNLVSSTDGFLIAISGSRLNCSSAEEPDLPRIVQVLFGLGDPFVRLSIGPGGGRIAGGGIHPRRSRAKPSGAQVQAKLFADGSAPEVSSVLFLANTSRIAHGVRAGSSLSSTTHLQRSAFRTAR